MYSLIHHLFACAQKNILFYVKSKWGVLYWSTGGHGWGVCLYTAEARLSTSPLLVITQLPNSWNINCTLIICWGSVLSVFMFHIHQQGQWSDPPPTQSIPSRPLTLIHPPCPPPPPTPDTTHTHATALLVVTPAKSLSILLPLLVICFSFGVLPLTNPDLFLTQLVQRSPASGPVLSLSGFMTLNSTPSVNKCSFFPLFLLIINIYIYMGSV